MINWPFLAPRIYAAYVVPFFVFITLFVYSTCDAALSSSVSHMRRPKKVWLLLLVPLSLFAGIVVDALSLRAAGFAVLTINSSAMEKTVMQGDRIMFDFRYYRHRELVRGDLVLLKRDDLLTVKRVIAVGGDTVQASDRQVFLNGKPLEEPYVEHTQAQGNAPELDNFGPISIPSGRYFVMGDNRDVSLDSRTQSFGLIESRSIAGRPLYSVGSHRTGKRLQ